MDLKTGHSKHKGEQTLNEIIFFCNFTEACQLSNFLATTVSNNFPYKPVILETYLTQQNWSLFKDGSIQSKKKISPVCNYKIALHCGHV